MELPNLTDYLDLNSDRKFAPINMDKISVYLKKFDKAIETNSVNLWKEKYLCYLRLCHTESYHYVRSACRAEMKKCVMYIVDISFEKDGHVHETQCECAAGMGPNAHCKHVCALLYACHMFTVKKSIITEQTCTQKLQTFHHAPQYKGSAVKARDIVMGGCGEFSNVSFDPRPEEYRGMLGYSDFFRNICMNFKGISSMPIFQLFQPANNLAVAHDHNYLKDTPEDTFLQSINVSKINEKERMEVEVSTRGQNKNETWHNERQKRIQSSHYGHICKATERSDMKKIASALIENRKIKSEAIVHGLKYEKEAIKKYENDKGVTVKDWYICVQGIPFSRFLA